MEIQTRVGNVTDAPASAAGKPAVLRTPLADGMRALLAIALVVLVFQLVEGLNGDTSWLVTVAERWLDGARPFVDILELNPPSSVLMLLPAVLIGRLMAMPPEPIVIALVVLAAVASIELTVRQSARIGLSDSPARSRLVLGFALLVLPMSTFAERDHLAAIALVPMWAAIVARGEARDVPRLLMIVAGLGGGLAMCIKPQFAAAILLPALVAARATRRFDRLFMPEFWIAGAVFAAFAGLVLVVFPEYGRQMVPLVLDLYRPVREPLDVVLSASVLGWTALALIGLALVARDGLTAPRLAVPLLAGLGCLIGVIDQSKGFAYHYYPVVAALVPALADHGLVLANARLAPGTSVAERLVTVCGFLLTALGLTFATLFFLGLSKPMRGLMDPIARIASHPTIIGLSPHMWVNHPLARDVGGRWVGSVPSQWMTIGALYKLGLRPPDAAERQRLIGVIAADKARFVADLARGRPDVVVVEPDDLVFRAWFASRGEFEALLAGYTRAADYLGIEVWRRNPA